MAMISYGPNKEKKILSKRKPTGFVAICQCGVFVGAMDYNRTDRKEADKIIGKWLANGCTVEPRFESSWSERIKSCKCSRQQGDSSDKVIEAIGWTHADDCVDLDNGKDPRQKEVPEMLERARKDLSLG